MSLNRTSRPPAVPTPPRGEQIAAYDTYLEAQRAVDHLSDKEFPVQHVTIVGRDLQMVERVTGRLTYSRVALAGLATGAWFGLFVGLLLSLVATPEGAFGAVVPAVAIGAAFGILFSVISYSFTGGKRDFTSASQIVASTYAVLCAGEQAHRARSLLLEQGGPGVGRHAPAAPSVPTAPSVPSVTTTPPAPPAVRAPNEDPGNPPSFPPAGPTGSGGA